MYVIYVEAPISSFLIERGLFTNCYQATINSSRGTWIAFTRRDDEWLRVKKFKSLKAAMNKVKFLKQKIDENGYMFGWEVQIKEVDSLIDSLIQPVTYILAKK